jgi:isoamylase
VYRSSPHAWQHPDSIKIPGSQIDEASGAMMSPMTKVSSTTQSITIAVPAGLSPVTFAFLISITPDASATQHATSSGKKLKRRFAVPLEGRHFSALLGAQPGTPTPLGPSTSTSSVSKTSGSKKSKKGDTTAVNFAVRSRGGTSVSLVLMQPPASSSSTTDGDNSSEWTCVELALDPTLNRTGDTWHITLPSLRNVEKLCYGWRVDGDVSWESGYRITPEAVLVDPEAPALVHLPSTSAPPLPLPCVELADGSHVLVVSAVSSKFDSEEVGRSAPLYRPLEKMRVLEIDVKTFAQGGKVKHPGTFVGVTERLDHIRAVGANTVILAPCHATAKGAGSHSHHAALSFMAPDPALSTDPTNPAAAHAEFREMVHALHAAGVEVIPSLDLTFTADGVDAHPTGVSLRGLDNASYFRPNGVVNCGHPAFQALVQRATRHWALQFGVDGFCFINAENMAQDAEGFVMDAPSFPEALCQDPILSGLKLVAAPSQGTSLLPRGGARGFPHWGIWQQRNSAFTRDVTALLAEVSHVAIDNFAARLTGSADIFGAGWSHDEMSPLPGNLAAERRPSFSFNAAAMQHGPSVKNLAAEAAGAAGAAVMASGGGPLPTATTIAKSMLLAALLAQGVPVINHEDVAEVEMARFVGVVSRLRRKLAHLLLPPKFDSPRDLQWHGAHAASEPEWVGAAAAASGGEGEEGGDYVPYHAPHGSSYIGFSVRHPDGSAVYVGFNPHPMTVTATLPAAPAGHTWLRAVDTSLEAPLDAAMENFEQVDGSGAYLVSGKAAIVLVAAIVEQRAK